MSDSNGPVRRRRIAGESKPEAPVKKATSKKVTSKKAAPVKKAAPTAKTMPTRKPVATAAIARPAPPDPSTRVAPGTTPGLQLRRFIPAIVGATAVLVAGIVLLVLGLTGGSGDDGLDESRKQATAAAGTAAETIFSFKYNELDEHLSSSKAVMTPSFAKDFDAIAPALTDLAPQRKIVVEAVTREAAPLACGDECSASKVNVLVFVDQARLVGGSDEPTVFANRISVSMVKSDDGWLVDDIRAL